ncbi:MAG: serine hydroxymethyltransferase [Candidatus Xiphinematobacter sp.]|nr:MAG: serine hydroxymethyltransferase [Candidatus Xiphinematobacter sp.]
MQSVLFVCAGNTCRSPMAEALLKKLLCDRKDVEVWSAGLHALSNAPPSQFASQILQEEEGIDISSHRSRPLVEEHIRRATHIFVMSREQKRRLTLFYPSAASRSFLLRELESSDTSLDIPDPIGNDLGTYRRCKDTIKNAVQKILALLDRLPSSFPTLPQLDTLDPETAQAIFGEQRRQFEHIELIASENYASVAVMQAQSSCLTNKYAEGYPGRRWYGGCEFVDTIELLAVERAKKLFGAEHANVQPHSGSQANMAVCSSCLEPGDRVLTMDLSHGGHLTHGHKANFSGKLYEIYHYGVDQRTERIDYDALVRQAETVRPKLIIAGASAYSRIINFALFKQIADLVDALLLVDMAHIAGLVAGGAHPSPVPYADFVTATTHKSLRGPRAGLILCKQQHAKKVDSTVFPGIQGGPLPHVIAAKAVCFYEALQPAFASYARQVIANSRLLAAQLSALGYRIVSGGTDNHMFLLDLRPQNIHGAEAQGILDKAAITVNKNALPFDTEPITKTGGVRLGTPAVTTRGVKEEDIGEIAGFVDAALKVRADDQALAKIRSKVVDFTLGFPPPAVHPSGWLPLWKVVSY